MSRAESKPMWVLAGIVATLAGVVPTSWATTYPAADSPEMRVATIGYRLATRNRDRCVAQAPITGLVLHDLASYAQGERAAVAAYYGLGEGVSVLGTAAGSPAERAGLQPGDEIVALKSTKLADALPAPGEKASFDRVEAFLAMLDIQLRRGPAMLSVRRQGREQAISIESESACAARFALMPGDRPEAWSDERYVAVTRGLVLAANDDELAFAMGHELAHIALGHAGEPHSMLTALVGIGGGRSRERERAADRLGLSLLNDAGYDPRGAEPLLMLLAGSGRARFNFTHPSFRERIETIRRSLAETAAP